MNQRIKELSYEAQRYALNNTTGSDLAGLNELWHEKFAELIVRECAEVCMKEIDTGWVMAPKSPWMAKQILEHFGVEN